MSTQLELESFGMIATAAAASALRLFITASVEVEAAVVEAAVVVGNPAGSVGHPQALP